MVHQKKTVWIFNFFAGNRDSGWGERHFFLAKEMIKENFEILIFSSTNNHMFENKVVIDAHYEFRAYEGVKFCWIKVPAYKATSIKRFWSMMVFSIKLFFLPFKEKDKPDCIIVSSMPMFPILPALYWKWRLKINKLAFEVRDLWPLTPIHLGKISKYNPMIVIMGIIEKIAYKKSDIIISLLPKADGYINQFSGNPSKFLYLPNGISLDVDTEDSLPFNRDVAVPADKFIVGYAGSLGIANAMRYVIEAAKILQDNNIHFVILGDGYLKEELIDMSKDLTNVTFLPKVKKGVVSRVIAKFDVCIISWTNSTLYQYGVSANKLFDYMLAAKPIVLAGNLADNPVELSQSGICTEPENPGAIASAILELYNMNADERQKLGSNGFQFLKTYHVYPYLAKKLVTRLNE